MKNEFSTTKNSSTVRLLFLSFSALLIASLAFSGCSSERLKNRAKESAARFWQDKAYPGKSYDVQVIEAEKTSDGNFRVKGIVDGETRVGTFSPDTETFSEGYYSLAHERSKRIAELEQESKYWKEKAEGLEKEIYKLKVQLSALKGGKAEASTDEDSPQNKEKTKEKSKE
jgi:hypothetical protein